MSKKLIAISIAAIMIGLFSTAALAGVEGSFDFDISLQPVSKVAPTDPFAPAKSAIGVISTQISTLESGGAALVNYAEELKAALEDLQTKCTIGGLDISTQTASIKTAIGNLHTAVESLGTFPSTLSSSTVSEDATTPFGKLAYQIWLLGELRDSDGTPLLDPTELDKVDNLETEVRDLYNELHNLDTTYLSELVAADYDDPCTTNPMANDITAITNAVTIYNNYSDTWFSAITAIVIDLSDQLPPAPVAPPANQYSNFKSDFEGRLTLDITLSGLTFSNDLAFGVAGIEHYIADLETTLGALNLKDEFWFAAPFDADHNKLGDLQFVGKRVTTDITLAGLTLENQIIFEDINWSHPYEPPLVDPVYRFGTILTISGETVSGIGVKTITGLCADPELTNSVKKYGPVNGKVTCPPENGDWMGFEVEKVKITDISISGFTIDNSYEFRPGEPISSTLTVDYTLLNTVDVSASLTYDNIVSLGMSSATYTASTDPLTVVWTDANGDFTMSSGDTVKVTTSLSLAPSFTLDATLYTEPGTGFVVGSAGYAAEFVGTLALDSTEFTTTADYVTAAGNLQFDSVVFGLDTTVNDLRFETSATFTLTGLTKAQIGFGLDFAL